MTASVVALPVANTASLVALIERASASLAKASTAAEVLEARDIAGMAYDVAKKTARLAQAKHAHDDIVAAAYRAQADALEIEAQAKRRLADEYDAAQDRGEVARIGDNLPNVPKGNSKPVAADLGLTRKDIHEARLIRDAEAADPGVVRRALETAIASGHEPSKAKVRRAVLEIVKAERPAVPSKPLRKRRPTTFVEQESQHDCDLRMLKGVWAGACETARTAFLEWVEKGQPE